MGLALLSSSLAMIRMGVALNVPKSHHRRFRASDVSACLKWKSPNGKTLKPAETPVWRQAH